MRIKRNSSTSQNENQPAAGDDVNVGNIAVKLWKLCEPKVILSVIDDDDDYVEPKDKATLRRIQSVASNLVEVASPAGI